MMKAIDIALHGQPLEMMKPECRALMRSRPEELATVMELAADARRFVELMDKEGIERVGIINYVAPVVMGFTEEVNPWAANYARDFRDRLIPFGSVDPTTAKDAADTMGRILYEGELPATRSHPSSAAAPRPGGRTRRRPWPPS